MKTVSKDYDVIVVGGGGAARGCVGSVLAEEYADGGFTGDAVGLHAALLLELLDGLVGAIAVVAVDDAGIVAQTFQRLLELDHLGAAVTLAGGGGYGADFLDALDGGVFGSGSGFGLAGRAACGAAGLGLRGHGLGVAAAENAFDGALTSVSIRREALGLLISLDSRLGAAAVVAVNLTVVVAKNLQSLLQLLDIAVSITRAHNAGGSTQRLDLAGYGGRRAALGAGRGGGSHTAAGLYVLLHHIAGKLAVANFVPVAAGADDIHLFTNRQGLQRFGFLACLLAQDHLGVGPARGGGFGGAGHPECACGDHHKKQGAEQALHCIFGKVCVADKHHNMPPFGVRASIWQSHDRST